MYMQLFICNDNDTLFIHVCSSCYIAIVRERGREKRMVGGRQGKGKMAGGSKEGRQGFIQDSMCVWGGGGGGDLCF